MSTSSTNLRRIADEIEGLELECAHLRTGNEILRATLQAVLDLFRQGPPSQNEPFQDPAWNATDGWATSWKAYWQRSKKNLAGFHRQPGLPDDGLRRIAADFRVKAGGRFLTVLLGGSSAFS